MTGSEAIINFAAYAIFASGPLLVWLNRYNVPAVSNLPFIVTAYLVPLSIFPYSDFYSVETVQLLTTLNAVGAISMLLGIIVGWHMRLGARPLARYCPLLREDGDCEILNVRLRYALGLGLLGVAFCFAWMGMVPMFADDPFLAKFFRGEYKEKFDQISIVYRFSQYTIVTLLPIAFAVIAERRDIKLVVLVLASVGAMGVALQRGPVGAALILFLYVWATRSRGATVTVTVGSTLLYLVGSIIYLFLGLVQGQGDLLSDVSAGAPDISDHLRFLSAFNPATDLTYGLTFVGGLIPGNFAYNPSVFSLAIVNPGGEISDISSGGYRMPPSIWGYTAFSWPGVVAVCLVSGLVLGGCTSVLRRMPKEQSLVNRMLMVLWFQIIVGFVANFYAMFYYNLVSIAVFLAVCRIRRRRSRRTAEHSHSSIVEQASPIPSADRTQGG